MSHSELNPPSYLLYSMDPRRLSIADFLGKYTTGSSRNRNTTDMSNPPPSLTTVSPISPSPEVAPPLSCFTDDVATMPTAKLLQHGEQFAKYFLSQCGRARHVSRRLRYSTSNGRGEEKAKDVYCKYDAAAKTYSVHAVTEIQAGLKEVLELLAGDIDPTSSRHGFNVFLWRVFGSALDSATNLRCTKERRRKRRVQDWIGEPEECPVPTTDNNDDGSDDEGSDDDVFLTMKKIKQSYEGAAVKQTTFVQSNFFLRKSKAEWLLLDYIQKRSDSSIVRVFKSVDNTTSYPQLHRGKVIPRHTRILFGFHIEELSFHNGGVCRVTFFGSHEATKATHASHRLLQKLGESLHTIDLAVLRRRLGHKAQLSKALPPSAALLGDMCVHCRKFTNGIVCRLCAGHVCAVCSSIEEVEAGLHNVFELRVCGPCVELTKQRHLANMKRQQRQQQTHPPLYVHPIRDTSPLLVVVGLSQRGMFRISEATLEGSYHDMLDALQTTPSSDDDADDNMSSKSP
ncbi:hypothetical protein B5M09_002687 [Aphanomyces astaci]|uniref:FYVE-type domain-containing protein n=2 Tax=Aphanomyces astaci TaxID=112090 RepID=A0A425DA35_APHAT|nr:hypothetical protein B5M09_002687 [Aphanomyces astaci]